VRHFYKITIPNSDAETISFNWMPAFFAFAFLWTTTAYPIQNYCGERNSEAF